MRGQTHVRAGRGRAAVPAATRGRRREPAPERDATRAALDDGRRRGGRGRRGRRAARARPQPEQARLRRRPARARRGNGGRVADAAAGGRAAPRSSDRLGMGGIDLPIPDQEVEIADGDYRLAFRAPAPRRGLERADLDHDRTGRGEAHARREGRPHPHAAVRRRVRAGAASAHRRGAARRVAAGAVVRGLPPRARPDRPGAGGRARGVDRAAPRLGLRGLRRERPEASEARGHRRSVRAHDGAAAAARRPLRGRGLRGGLRGDGRAGMGPRRAAGAARDDEGVESARAAVRVRHRLDRRGGRARGQRRRRLPGRRRRRRPRRRRRLRPADRAGRHGAHDGTRPAARAAPRRPPGGGGRRAGAGPVRARRASASAGSRGRPASRAGRASAR